MAHRRKKDQDDSSKQATGISWGESRSRADNAADVIMRLSGYAEAKDDNDFQAKQEESVGEDYYDNA